MAAKLILNKQCYLCDVKKFLAFLLSFQLLILSLGGIKATIYYSLNKAYIIKELCIQKDEVKNTCQGQCHLEKTIKKQAEDDEGHQLVFEGQLAPFCAERQEIALVPFAGAESMATYSPWLNAYVPVQQETGHRPPPALI